MTCLACGGAVEGRGLQCGRCLQAPREAVAATETPAPVVPELPATALEATVQPAVIDRLVRYGFKCWRVGQRDARGTQDSGPSDVIAIHKTRPVIAFVECKRREGGVQSEAQREFQAWVERAGGIYVLANDPSVIDAWWRAMSERGEAA